MEVLSGSFVYRGVEVLEFDWDDENRTHIAVHHVTTLEAEYVLEHETADLGYQDWHDEERFAEIGMTAAGRILVIITTWRGIKTRVVTAYDATKSDRDLYRKLELSL